MPTPRYLLIANPGTRRCETYHRELLAYWADRGVKVDVEVVPWAALVPRDGNLDGLPAFDRPAVVRLESPGKDDGVTRLMLEAGAGRPSGAAVRLAGAGDPHGPAGAAGAVVPRLSPGAARPAAGVRYSAVSGPYRLPPGRRRDVRQNGDGKEAPRRRSAGAQLVGGLRDVFAEVADAQDGRGWPTVYLKLNTGSSATGIIAIRSDGTRFHGETTLAEIDGRFFNSRRLLHLTGPALERAADFLLTEGAFAQQGIPMAQVDGQNFDVRVVCIGARPAASIFRLSPGPMTNLHLGGRRGDFALCRALVPTRDWLDALDHCADAASCFDSTIAGVDLVFERGFARHYVLEVNAFGDFFPGWTDAGGRSVHRLEIEETARKLA